MELEQGKKSVVSLETFGGMQCVRKEYNDNGNPRGKCLREIAFYRWYAGVEKIPLLVEIDCPSSILISYLPGMPLSAWHKNQPKEKITDISYQHGCCVGGVISHEPSSEDRDEILHSGPGKTDFPSLVAAALKKVLKTLKGIPELNRSDIVSEVENARNVLNASDYWAEEVMCKLDWNPGNTIVEYDSISGYIDFEQAFIGNRLGFVGTLIDHINVLSWPDVKRGLEEQIGDLPLSEQLYAGACFSMCYKLKGCCRDGKVTYFTPERLITKFAQMRKMIFGE